MKRINSDIFGAIDLLDPNDEEFKKLESLIWQYPANAFGILNKVLNNLELMLKITK